MKNYNRIMEWFWLSVTIIIVVAVTFMGIKEGFSTWMLYYVFALMTSGTYLLRRYMRRRMDKHMQEMENKGKA